MVNTEQKANEVTLFKSIWLCRIPFLHLIIGIGISCALMAVISFISVFAFWSIYGDGAPSSNPPISEFFFINVSLFVPLAICCFLIFRKLKLKEFALVKLLTAIALISTLLFFIYSDAFLS
jgi:hypothetical protein